MHIPDGYLSPETVAAAYAISIPVWLRATHKVRKLISGRSVPLVALFAAFSFIIMMFNVPLPGGTTGHAVGSALAAIVLGPWAAVLTTSIALIIQALFFGDGGILALGPNVLNMAIAMPFAGYLVYRWLEGGATVNSRRRVLAGAFAGYVAINISALLTGVELGLQPILFHDSAGRALYFPYPLQVSVPAMMLGHLTLAGAVEAAVTGLVIAWLQRSNPQILNAFAGGGSALARTVKLAWAALLALLVLTPIGLLAPGTAWGEWSREQLSGMGLGYIPAGFDRFSGFWTAPFAGYNIPILSNPTVTYALSALLGVALVVVMLAGVGWMFEHLGEGSSRPKGSARNTERISSPADHKRATAFIEKTLANISGALEQSLFAEALAREPGLLQSVDPRTKLAGALALLVAVSFSHNLLVIGGIYLLTLPIAYASRVPLGFYLKRVSILMPFFTGIIALPALFSVFTPGPPLWTLVDLASPRLYLAITWPGVVTAAFLLLRVGTSVSIAILLIMTTRWNLILNALRVIQAPQAFVLILGMTYRYIFVLLRAANDMFLARNSRRVGRLSGSEERKWIAGSMGALLSKSYELSDEVYLAMQSRGFRGQVRTLDTLAWRTADTVWLAAMVAVAAMAIWLGR